MRRLVALALVIAFAAAMIAVSSPTALAQPPTMEVRCTFDNPLQDWIIKTVPREMGGLIRWRLATGGRPRVSRAG